MTDGLDVVDAIDAQGDAATELPLKPIVVGVGHGRRDRVSRVAAVVLAAGEGSRFGGAEAAAAAPVGARAARDAAPSTRSWSSRARTRSTTSSLPPVRLVRCTEWERGPGASLRCGLAALGADVDAAVVVLADGPDLAPEAIARVVVATGATRGGAVVAASYDGARGHPLLVARSAWDDVPDEGLRASPPVLVPCDDLGAPGDVDHPDDLPRRAATGARTVEAAPGASERSCASFSIRPAGMRSAELTRMYLRSVSSNRYRRRQ